MVEETIKLLFVDDDEDDFVLVRELLDEGRHTYFHVDWVQNYDQAVRKLTKQAAEQPYDGALVDYRLGEKDGIALIRELKAQHLTLPVILLTGQGDYEVDVAAMEAGAADFLNKAHLTPGTLERALRYSIHYHKIEAQRARLLALAQQQARQLRYLASELTQAEQRERRRVAQTLHDHLQQLLVAAKMRVAQIPERKEDPDLQRSTSQIESLLQQSIEASRSLSVQLSPPVLHDRGLAPALEWLVRQYHKEYDLHTELQASDEVRVEDDHLRDFLFQAVRELLFNVVKHAEAGHAEVQLAPTEDRMIQLSIRDKGKGCQPENVLKDSAEGFGLFHLRQRVNFLGGRFELRSAPGGGCEARLIVPPSPTGKPMLDVPEEPEGRPGAQPPSADAAPATLAAASDAAAIRVLLVDDHEILREGIATLLGDEPGVQVVGEGANGQEAVKLAQRLRPDVVVMDVSMPVMSGIDATRAITAQWPDIRVIGLSMHERDDMAAAMHDAGADAYLPKGGPSEHLVEAIFGHAAQERSPAPTPTS